MPCVIVVGGQWGDEGKGKIVDHLTARAQGVVRYQGGPNAGHTVVIGDTPLDIAAALSAGARAVGVATGGYPASALRAAGAHAVLTDLSNTAAVLAALLAGPAPFRLRAQRLRHWLCRLSA